MARIPGIDSVFGLLQAQTEALAALPATVASLAGAVRNLGEVLVQTRDAVQAVHRLAVRSDAIVAELEEPLLALAPGLRRLAGVLDDPVVDDLPDLLRTVRDDVLPGLRRMATVLDDPVVDDLPSTIRQVQEDVLPVLRTLADTHERVAFIAGQTDRIMTFVDDASRSLAGLPGAALLGRRRAAAARVIDAEATRKL